MPDRRRHRGPHQRDAELFSPEHRPTLAAAVLDLSWLLSRGYAPAAAKKLVGDRHRLVARQREAVARSACGDAELHSRARRRVERVAGETVAIDGFNVLLTVESALAGGVVLVGRDGCYRDLASVHGTYRAVSETEAAVERVGERLTALGVARSLWLLDRPVSNSGRLRATIERIGAERGFPFEVELEADPDAALVASAAVVASADSRVLDGAARWLNLARAVVDAGPEPPELLVDLRGEPVGPGTARRRPGS